LKKSVVSTDSEEDVEASEQEKTRLQDIFGIGGAFETSLSFFRHRPMQLAMAEAVEQALAQNQVLFAEAPTGTGKSLAYLVPAIRWSLENPEEARQVIVSSNTKGLQDQLFKKDIGEIKLALHSPLRAAVLKGRNNYLCKRRFRSLLREANDRLSDLDRIKLMPLMRWSELTITGDITEIGGFNEKQHSFLWAQVASDSQACAGSACSAAKGDFHRMAQDHAAGAHIVFINHALLMSDLNRFVQRPTPLRKFVLDEAHHIERAVVSATTQELSASAFRNCLLRLADERAARGLLFLLSRKYESESGEELLKEKERLLDIVRSLFGIARDSFSTLAESLPLIARESSRVSKVRFKHGDRIHTQILRALSPLVAQWSELSSGLKKLERLVADLKGEEKLSAEILFEIKSVSESVEQHGAKLIALHEEDDPNVVSWIESGLSSHGGWCNIFSAPISVGKAMVQGFWPHVDSVVMSSATLSAGQSFAHLKASLGLDDFDKQRIREITFESPFDLQQQMRILIPTFLPSPRADKIAHESAVTEMVSRTVEDIQRGTLVLCTSLDFTVKLTEALDPIARRTNRALFSQSRGGSPNELLDDFRAEGNAILVGAASFWEGIDVVGDALQILVVAKLPFDVPTEPWVEARSEAPQNEGHDAFQDFSLPVATLRLKQGIGRLIRHPQDRGVAIIADPRLMKTAFGRMIRDSLPVPADAVQSLDELMSEIEHFFAHSLHD
jgi:Rad3-related DNA helicase